MPLFGGRADDARIMATLAKHAHRLHTKAIGGHHHTLPRANVIAFRGEKKRGAVDGREIDRLTGKLHSRLTHQRILQIELLQNPQHQRGRCSSAVTQPVQKGKGLCTLAEYIRIQHAPEQEIMRP